MSGKSYIIDRIMELKEKLFVENQIIFHPASIPKYTTRPYRIEEIRDISKGKRVDVESCEKIPDDCELKYQTYGKKYGLSIKDIEKHLNNGESPVIIINDVRVVEEIKKYFPEQVLALFLFREIPKLSSFEKIANDRGNTSKDETIDRYNKATAIYRTFIENIALFDRVILNPKRSENSIDYAQIQIENVVKGVLDGRIKLNIKKKNTPKLFIISGNAASGKDEIIQAVNDMGKLQAHILPKYTSRMQDETDGEEMICQYVPRKDLLEQYKLEYEAELRQKEKDFQTRESEAEYDVEKLVKIRAEILQEKHEIKNEYQRFWQAIAKEKEAQCESLRKRILNEADNKFQLSSLDLFDKSYNQLCAIYKTEGYHKKGIDPEQFLRDNSSLSEQELINLISDESSVEVDLRYDKLKKMNEKELWKLYEREGYHSKDIDVSSFKESISQNFLKKFYMHNPEYIIDLEKIRDEKQKYISRKIRK